MKNFDFREITPFLVAMIDADEKEVSRKQPLKRLQNRFEPNPAVAPQPEGKKATLKSCVSALKKRQKSTMEKKAFTPWCARNYGASTPKMAISCSYITKKKPDAIPNSDMKKPLKRKQGEKNRPNKRLAFNNGRQIIISIININNNFIPLQ